MSISSWLSECIVDSWCVMMSVVWLIISCFIVCWISSLFLLLRFDVVLLRIRIGVLVRNVCVIVMCWCLLFDSLILCLLISVL